MGGLGTAVLALALLPWIIVVALSSAAGVGVPLVPATMRMVRAVADRERARLSRWGPDIVGAEPLPSSARRALRTAAVRRELAWTASHAVFGFGMGLIGLSLPLYAIQNLTFPLWWRLQPAGETGPGLGLWSVHDAVDALAVGLLGLGWVVVVIAVGPVLARLQAWPGRILLSATTAADLSLRVAQLTATRAAALDAHAVELRRIERSLHDGTQNRLVAVTVLLGAARRALSRDPAGVKDILDRAQDAAEQALAELRTVARSILPPVLVDRGLASALQGLTGACPVPCRLDLQVDGRCAVSVEATTYFAVAEALTNVARHSGATAASVTVCRKADRLLVRIVDDGRGGAQEYRGSGLRGIRRRVEAFDGVFTVTSPSGGPTTMQLELPCGS
ncbi:sensor histidine kinase [Micromonospora inyonensis]|uniref:sensor histidine kinase n=1 Tax=Micromonospora inyonensis TaxID=47866 RepID=UPI001FE23E39|nr:sensor histidine kinase [Micromonospora inyonensis]